MTPRVGATGTELNQGMCIGARKPVFRPRGYTTFSMLNSAEHEIYPAHKCWHFNIY